MKKYCIKIGERFVSWVDECWYETKKECTTTFNDIVSVKETIKQLKKHYVYKATIWEIDGNDFKEVKLHKNLEPDSYFVTHAKPLKIKAKIKF